MSTQRIAAVLSRLPSVQVEQPGPAVLYRGGGVWATIKGQPGEVRRQTATRRGTECETRTRSDTNVPAVARLPKSTLGRAASTHTKRRGKSQLAQLRARSWHLHRAVNRSFFHR